LAKIVMEPVGGPRERFLPRGRVAGAEPSPGQLNAALPREGAMPCARMGAESYEARVREKGKLPTWERIEKLKDPGSPVLPIGTLVNHGDVRRGREDLSGRRGRDRVRARPRPLRRGDRERQHRGVGVVVAAHPEKIQRAQEVALRLRFAGRLPGGLVGSLPAGASRTSPVARAPGGSSGPTRSCPPPGCRRSRACTATASRAAATCRSSATSSNMTEQRTW